MTDQEAIKWIDGQIRERCRLVLDGAAKNEKLIKVIDEEGAALLQARKALHKRIPKKPEIKKYEGPFARFGKSGIIIRTRYACPACSNPLYVQNHFEYTCEDSSGFERWPVGSQTPCCPKCGQALKWEEDHK